MFCLMLSLGKLVFTIQFQSKTWKSFEWLNSQIIKFFFKSSVLEAFNLIWSKGKGQWLENLQSSRTALCPGPVHSLLATESESHEQGWMSSPVLQVLCQAWHIFPATSSPQPSLQYSVCWRLSAHRVFSGEQLPAGKAAWQGRNAQLSPGREEPPPCPGSAWGGQRPPHPKP